MIVAESGEWVLYAGVYGDVSRVKIMFNKKDTALVQFADPGQAQIGERLISMSDAFLPPSSSRQRDAFTLSLCFFLFISRIMQNVDGFSSNMGKGLPWCSTRKNRFDFLLLQKLLVLHLLSICDNWVSCLTTILLPAYVPYLLPRHPNSRAAIELCA